MPYVNKPRPYKRENELYKSKPEQIAKRVARNKARRTLMAEGVVKKGDGGSGSHQATLIGWPQPTQQLESKRC